MTQNNIRTISILFVVFSFFSLPQTAQAAGEVPNIPSDVYVERGTNNLIVTKPNSKPAKYVIKGVSWSPATRAPQNGPNPLNPKATVQYGFFFDWDGRNPQGHEVMNYWLENQLVDNYKKDIPLMKQLNVNTVRIYHSLGSNVENYNNVAAQLMPVLDEFYRNGIMVIMTVAMTKGDFEGENPKYLKVVQAFKNHPAILMWAIGNEWNFNKLYDASNISDVDKYWQAIDMVDTAARRIKQADPRHPVCSILGDQLGKADDITPVILYCCYNVDIWGLNVYRGKTFGNLFSQWKDAWRQFRIPAKPFFISECGIDSFYSAPGYSTSIEGEFTRAYNVKGSQAQGAQAEYDRSLWQDILSHLSIGSANEYCLGGLVHEFNDELWKVGNFNIGLGFAGALDTGYFHYATNHSYDDYNSEGFTWAGAPFDGVMNEEYFGLVSADRQPKIAYNVLKQDWNSGYFSGRVDVLNWYWDSWRLRSAWQALKGAKVYIYGANNFYKTTVTDTNGNIKLMSLPQGNYWVIIYSPRGQWQYELIQIKKDAHTQGRFYLR